MSDNPQESEDRFRSVAAHYDRWVDWEPRLAKELPFLLESLSFPREGDEDGLLDVGCGTGAHAIALAAAGHRVTGLDKSPSMLEEAHAAEQKARAEGRLAADSTLEWLEGDITDPAVLGGRRFAGVLALGNALLSIGEEEQVLRGLRTMIRLVAPGGSLILQFLNGTKIRHQGRLVVKDAGSSNEGRQLFLRHHFEAGGSLYFHAYVLRQGCGDNRGGWTAEVTTGSLVDLTPEKLRPLVEPHFATLEFFDGLTGRPFRIEESDALGLRASGRRESAA